MRFSCFDMNTTLQQKESNYILFLTSNVTELSWILFTFKKKHLEELHVL